jgi:hypothetical protein
MRLRAFALALLVAAAASPGRAHLTAAQNTAVIVYDATRPSVAFAVGDLRDALGKKGYRVEMRAPAETAPNQAALTIAIGVAGDRVDDAPSLDGVGPEGYAIRKTRQPSAGARWIAMGRDATGAMYAGLELAEDVTVGAVADGERRVTPALPNRGIKFNIPLDARTPSYSDDSTSAQANIAEMWSMDFWTRMLDQMARDRYNLLSLWSLSPFPSLVNVPGYPGVSLADVKKKAGPIWDADLQGRRMYDPSWALETVKTMTIDEKIAFWRGVMQHAHDRGIDVSLFTWNIFVYGTEGSPGITTAPDNATTKDYLRKAVRATFNTYPLLASIGVTSGENMGRLDADGKEAWMWETFGQGTADAMADAKDPASPFYNPSRVIRFIHRAHQADLSKIIARFRELPGYDAPDSSLAFSFKYSQAHMYSSTKPLFIFQNGWFDTIPAGKKTFLTVRNDDMYYLRWGDPDFARAYLTSLPDRSKIAGFYMGPDGYTWGRDFVSKAPDTPRALVIDRQWYSFLLWGRLAYEPALPNDRFARIVAARFPGMAAPDAARLFGGWADVSKILPLVTRLYWGSLDYMWYPEASWGNTGYASVQDLITPKYRPMNADEDGETPRLMSVKAFVDGEAPAGRLTPIEVAAAIEQHADEGLARVNGLAPGGDRELGRTLVDIRAMAWLGKYYAAKIRGAVDLYRAQKSSDAADRERAHATLTRASEAWRQYAALWSSEYLPQVLTRMGATPVDIAGVQAFVDKDIP